MILQLLLGLKQLSIFDFLVQTLLNFMLLKSFLRGLRGTCIRKISTNHLFSNLASHYDYHVLIESTYVIQLYL